MRNTTNQYGFGLIQLLVVVAVVGLLSSLVIFVFRSYQARTRDARRLEDVNQIRTGLELFYANAMGYPSTGAWVSGELIGCKGTKLIRVPQDPAADLFYVYEALGKISSGCDSQVYSSYKFIFQTEGDTVIGPPGTYCLGPRGIFSTVCQ